MNLAPFRRKTRFITNIIAIAMMCNGLFNIVMGLFALASVNVSLKNLGAYANVFKLDQASSLLGLFLGFLLLLLGLGLLKRNYLAWLWSIILLIIVGLNGLFEPVSIATIVVSLVYLIVLLVYRRAFYNNRFTVINYSRIVAYLTVLFSLVYGVLGSYLLREQFHGLKTFGDAIYYTFVTYSTLGYGDIYPITENAKMFVCSMIVVGVSAFVATLTLVVAPLIQKRVEGVLHMVGKMNFKNHVILYGFNPLARHIVRALAEKHIACIFIALNVEELEKIQGAGFNAIVGNVHSTTDLKSLGINQSMQVIFASNDDANNILATMTAVNCLTEKGKAGTKIITRVEHEENIDKAYTAGANTVVSASQLAGEQVAAKVLE